MANISLNSMIYFIEDLKANAVKIGRTNDLIKRVQTLQTGNSHKIRCLYTIEAPDYFEQHIHSICTKYHKQGEWFRLEAITHLLKHPWFKKNMLKFRA